jgi:hypothetical protein
VAITIVELGLPLTNVHTALNVDTGLAQLQVLANAAVEDSRDGLHED